MDFVYRRQALAQFFTRPGAWEAPTPDEQVVASERLINFVYAAVRERFPEHEALIDQCSRHRFPLRGLFHDRVMGPLALDLMVERGLLLLPRPTA